MFAVWCVLCASFVFLKSCVSCQALAEAVQQNSTLTLLHLWGNNIGDEGSKAWCPVTMVSWVEKRSEEMQKARIKKPPHESDVRENDERRCNTALNLRCAMLVKQISVNWKLFLNYVSFSENFIRSCCLKLYSEATFSVRQQVALAEWVLPKFIDEKTMVGFSHVCGMMCAVCFIVFLKSCVSCQALAQAVEQNSTLTGLDLGGNKIGDEGTKARWLVRMGSWGEKHSEEIQKARIKTWPYESDIREMTKGDTTQRWFPDAFIRLKFVMTSDKGFRYFDVFGMYWPDPVWKEKQFITILFPKQVTLSVSNFRSSNQVLNGILIIRMLCKLTWFRLLVTLPSCASRSFRW